MTDPLDDRALTAVVLARVKCLLEQRAWDRRWMRATWTQARHDRETELRALVRLVRTARRLARTAPDPITASKAYTELGYHDAQAAYSGASSR